MEAILESLNAKGREDEAGEAVGWEVVGEELYVGVWIVVLARKGMKERKEVGGIGKSSVPCGALGGLMVSPTKRP